MTRGSSGSQSQADPIDGIVKGILDGSRQPTGEDVSAIITRMATAPSDARRRDLSQPLLDLIRQHGQNAPAWPTEFTHHWAKHVLGDGQWESSTSEAIYFHDLRQAILHPRSRLVLHRLPNGRSRAIVITYTSHIIPLERLGPKYGPELVVVYSADTGKILTGYMVKFSSDITSRPGTIWLRR